MAILALLPRAIASRSRAFSNVGRMRQRHTTPLFNSALPAFVTPNPSSAMNSLSSNYPLQSCIRPSEQGKFACFATASSNGDQLDGLTVKDLKDRLREEGLPTSGLKAELIERLSASSIPDAPREKKASSKKKKPPPKSPKRKFTINPNWQKEFNAKALTEEFDSMAKNEGFDDTTAHFADDDTFEDDFTDDDYILDLEGDEEDGDDVDDDIPDFGAPPTTPTQSMDERLASAKRDSSLGRITVPEGLDKFSQEVSFDDLKKLGFRREVNPFGNDETPRREQFKVITGSMACSGCGSNFQKDNDLQPGFLPAEKYEVQTKLSKIEDVQKQQEKAETADWSSDDEVDWLLKQGEPSSEKDEEDMTDLSVDEMAERMGLDLDALSQKKVLCKRCHGLQNFGTVDQKLRPGWTDEPTLSQEEFRKLLLPLREKQAVIIALVDLFDFSGSVLPELDEIAGDNPVILAANKADLLPSEMGQTRAENWVRRELEYANVKSIANIGGAVRMVSSKTGFGIKGLMEKAKSLAEEMDCDIYVVGAANAGKSTLVNYLVEDTNPDSKTAKYGGRKRAGNANKWKGHVTTSPLPGTTLKFIKIELGGGKSLYDTPGLLVPGCLTERLTPEELKIVVPKKKVEPITFRLAAGKCCLVGGLAKIELIGDCKPFLFTFFVANDIKLHLTDSGRADEFTAKHVGEFLTPPCNPGPERMEEIGEFEYHEIEIKGEGWKQAAADITLRGLGWVAVTGAGVAKVRIGVPAGIGISVRPPLMPFDVWEATAKYTGGRAVRKSGKTKGGKRRKGVGRN
eukprot:CAMPEP_0172311058 /NCGR_PEP_ID=MMETSP1058-20130122/13655_1 /TAXON_ID=83371 /ORGANISM="Detonula confervacea, Strain CCMP 353" /LENGTH=797 /DNA_ID=CAMNT_0013024115 /DNA_START=136 /DNA_END=2529 /DNA_ORIENTATION=-